jgi:O-antigen ligase
MAKGTKKKSTEPYKSSEPKNKKGTQKEAKLDTKSESGYLVSMGCAPKIGKEYHWFQSVPIVAFSSVIILIVQMASYQRPMQQFFWYSGPDDLTDFFSYYKMIGILVCAGLALLILLYRVFTQSFAIKKTLFYIPILIYSLLVFLSYGFSDYKEFALWGWNDRFEGTLVLIGYMIMLYYTINTINGERSLKTVLYSVGISSAILGLLGISQALDKDFFRTAFGQKLITPNVMTESGETINELIDKAKDAGELLLNFTFQNREIYQTVYNINYVSFYLSLLIPTFGVLLIYVLSKKEQMPLYNKIMAGALFALLMYNLIGSASSGGFLGMFVVVVFAIILLRKRLLSWWKPLLVVLVITILVGGISYDRWMPELSGAIKSVLGVDTEEAATTTIAEKHHIDYLLTEGNDIKLSVDGSEMVITTFPNSPLALNVKDSEGLILELVPTEVSPIYTFEDPRYDFFLVQPARSEDGSNFIIISFDQQEMNWVFRLTERGVLYNNGLGKTLALSETVLAIGWENNITFGSGRGYIWSRTVPMMAETLVLGTGADTYCLYYPHHDYVGKYNAGYDINIIVDKPHNMYMGMWTGTGGLSVIAILSILLFYFVQTIKLYWRKEIETFSEFAGIGIVLGVLGFAVSGLVNDSSVSVMPMFYTFLGMGIATNIRLLKDRDAFSESE